MSGGLNLNTVSSNNKTKPRGNDITSFCLSFLLLNIGMIIVQPPKVVKKIK